MHNTACMNNIAKWTGKTKHNYNRMTVDYDLWSVDFLRDDTSRYDGISWLVTSN